MGGIDQQLEETLAEGEVFEQCETPEVLGKRKRARVAMLSIQELIPDINERVGLPRGIKKMRLSTLRQYPWPLVHSSVSLFNVTEWLFWAFIVCCMYSSNMIRISRAKQQSVTINVLSSIIHRTAIKWILQTGSAFLATCNIHYVAILGLRHATFAYPTRLDYSSDERRSDLLNKRGIFLSLWTIQFVEWL